MNALDKRQPATPRAMKWTQSFAEKFVAIESTGLILLAGAAFTALTLAAVVTLFGANIRMLFGEGCKGALPATGTVSVKPTPIPAKPQPTDLR